MTQLTPFQLSDVDHTFRWRGAGGQVMHDPKKMRTGHLMNTLVMIWNHNMPEAAKIKPYIEHTFGPYYTDAYMKKAIRQLAIEVAKRDDMRPSDEHKLEHMLNWLAKPFIEAERKGRIYD